jgi:hypothetical protein
MTDSLLCIADQYDLTPEEVLEAGRLFDDSIDDSIEDVYELLRDHKELTTIAAIDELLHV